MACEFDLFGAARVAAIDLDPTMVARAQRRLKAYGDRVSVASGDVTSLAYPDGEFDAVFNFAVLHHVPDWRQAVGEIVRVLATGGRFFSQDHDVAYHDWVSRHLFRHPPGRLTNAEFIEHLATVGLDIIGVDDQSSQLLIVATKRN